MSEPNLNPVPDASGVKAPRPARSAKPAPAFDSRYPVSSGAPILLERLQVIRAAQKAEQAAHPRPKLHPLARFLNSLWIWLLLADIVLIFAGVLAHVPVLFIQWFFALSLLPRVLVNSGQMLGLVRRDFFGAPLTPRAYLFGVSIFLVFVASISFWQLYFLLPLVTIFFYGRLLRWAYRGMRVAGAAAKTSPAKPSPAETSPAEPALAEATTTSEPRA